MAKRAVVGVDLQKLAKVGAEVRLLELDQERAMLVAAFPGLGKTQKSQAPARIRKPQRKMTAAQRKAVSLRMKRYWAGKRGEKK